MSKKPASLTSDLLARKGEAGPSAVDPVSRLTIAPGRQPNLSGIGSVEGPSQGLYASADTERPAMYGTDNEEERPRPPEPEIIYTPEEEESGSRARLIAGAFVGIALLGGVLIALSLNDGGTGVAPISPDVTAMPEPAPAEPAQVAEAPAAPEAVVPGIAEAETPSEEPAVPDAAADASADVGTPESPTEAEVPAAPAKPVEPAQAEAPAAPAPAAKPAPAATSATAPASAGAWVVQIMALREEGAARTAWASLQKKYPSQLGGHALDIEKADLGDKGTFYRVRAAGFETKAAAQSACSGLKSAGQDCLVKSR